MISTQTLLNAVAAQVAGTALDVAGYDTVILTVSGTFSATVTFYGSTDGTTFTVPIQATFLGTGVAGTTATGVGIYKILCSGLKAIRPDVTAYTSGNVTVTGRAVPYSTQ